MALIKDFVGSTGRQYRLKVNRSRFTRSLGQPPVQLWTVSFSSMKLGFWYYLHHDKQWHSVLAINSPASNGYFGSQSEALSVLGDARNAPPGFDDVVTKMVNDAGNNDIVWDSSWVDCLFHENERLKSVAFGPWGRVYRI